MEELEFKKHKRFMLLCTIVSAIVFIAGMLAVFFFGTFTTIYTTTIVSSVECDEPEWSLVADMMGCNIIEVYSSSTAGTSAGSGFIVSTDDSGRAIAITNHHVIENNYNSIYVRTIYEDVGYVVSCTLLGYDEYHDVAVLRLPDWYAEGCFIDLMDPEGEGYAKGSFFSSTTMGEAVAAIGNASGAGLGLVSGVISNS